MQKKSRRSFLRYLGVIPVAASLHACGDSMRLNDAGVLPPAMNTDAGTPDAGSMAGSDASLPLDSGICDPSTSDALGPFFENGAPARTMIAMPDEPGDRLMVTGQLLDARDCRTPASNYIIDLWQADNEGVYHSGLGSDFRLRGMIAAAADGTFAFETIMPGRYALGGSYRPAHLHVRIYDALGGERLVTQLYFADDPFLYPNDPCDLSTCRSNDPNRILPLTRTATGWASEVRLFV